MKRKGREAPEWRTVGGCQSVDGIPASLGTKKGAQKVLLIASVASMIDQFNMPNIRLWRVILRMEIPVMIDVYAFYGRYCKRCGFACISGIVQGEFFRLGSVWMLAVSYAGYWTGICLYGCTVIPQSAVRWQG